VKQTKRDKGYEAIPLTMNRRMVIASATVSRKKNAIHCISEVDISEPRQWLEEYYRRTGEKLSFTAYIVSCLIHVIREHPELNSFRKRNRLILLHDLTVSVLIERDIHGEKTPEPVGIKKAQTKTYLQIHNEIREAQKLDNRDLGGLSDSTWIKWIPGCLLQTFVRIADKNIYMAKRYGKICVTAVGMFSKEPFWFIPHGTATVLLTIGSISEKPVKIEGGYETREHLCLTASFDHDIVDGAPASRFMNRLIELIKNGEVLKKEL
jgi:pyruvate/2-oxoglutarate dehydrogenase complex dihydrolipoamide acyltransferase (E2) component